VVLARLLLSFRAGALQPLPGIALFGSAGSLFDKLRANREGLAFVGVLPFVLSLSRHGLIKYRVVWQFLEIL
jgi:hypothetical protein